MRSSEYELVQNVILGAQALRVFTKSFVEASPQGAGPTLLHMLPILPIVFHEESVIALYRRRFDGGLDNALLDNRALFLGLQKRMQDMADQTFSAINVAAASGLINYDSSRIQFLPRARIAISRPENEDGHRICTAAGRLGYWSARLTLPDFAHKLGIQF